MHVLFVHQNFPAQFGHIASYLARHKQWQCTFISETAPGNVQGIEKIQYRLGGGATQATHYCSRTFENAIWHCDGVFNALAARPDIRPDLIVGHSGFGSTLFLPELYPGVPIVNLFEYYYRVHDPDCDMDFRRDLGWQTPPMNYLRARARNAMMLLDLHNCSAAYTPTRFQQSRFPAHVQGRMKVIFDGIDREIYHGHEEALRPPAAATRKIAGIDVPPGTRIVTYVSRGFESMRGFDIFMRAAKFIARDFPNVIFLIVGADRVAYGGDEAHTGGMTFKQWVASRKPFDLSRCHFLGRLPQQELGLLLAASDLHIYLTVPFVLSWSMMNAMSCGAVVLASDTSPVKEMIQDGQNGLLVDFFDAEGLAKKAVEVLKDPAAHRPLGRAAEAAIVGNYSLEAVMPRMLELYGQAMAAEPVNPAGSRHAESIRADPALHPSPPPDGGDAATGGISRASGRPAFRSPFLG